MESKDKDLYVAPAILVAEAETEGIICASDLEGTGNGYSGWN